MRTRFSFLHTLTILGLTLLLSFSPSYASSEGHNPNSSAVFAGDCARNTARFAITRTGWLDGMSNLSPEEQDKMDEGNKKNEIISGRMAAVCELMFGASVWDTLTREFKALGAKGRLKKLDTYKAVMAADKITQQALVEDYLKTLFDMDAEGISAGMALLAAQEKKREAAKDAAAKKKAAEEKAAKEKAAEEKAAIDDAFSVFDINAKDAAAKKKAAQEAAIIKGAAEVTLQMLEKYRSKTELQLNTQTYVDENGNKGTLWCNPGPCTAGSPLKHGWATGVGTFLPLKLVEDVKKTLGEAVNKEIATFSSATNRKIFNITKDALLASAETSDDPKLKSAAAMTIEQIKSNQVANEKSQEDKIDNPFVVDEAPVVEAPVEEAPVEEAPVEEAPVEEAPVEEAPVEEAPVEEAPVEEAPVEEAPVEEAPVEEAPVEEAPVEEAPVEEAPVEEAPVEEAPVEEAPVEEAPVEEAPVEEAPVEEAPVEEAPVEEAPVEEAPVEEAPVEEAPVEEAPVEEDHHHDDGTEAPVEEAPVEEAPVEEAPVEEAPVEEAPVEP